MCSLSEPDVARTAKRVAVIGAGSAGLAVALELLKEGHSVVVFEQARGLGGSWRVEPPGPNTHSSMYEGLRTNLPRHLMSYVTFPFIPETLGGRSHDGRPFPLQSEVLAYYEAFAHAHGLHEHVRFCSRVLRIDPIAASGGAGSKSTAAAPDAAARKAAALVSAAAAAAEANARAAAEANARGAACSAEPAGRGAAALAAGDEAGSSAGGAAPAAGFSVHAGAALAAEQASARLGQDLGAGGGGAVEEGPGEDRPAGSETTRWAVTWQQLEAEGATGAARHGQHVAGAQPANGKGPHGCAGRECSTSSGVLPIQREEFDAVVGCVGHHTKPLHPQMHAHAFRGCQPFAGMRVLVVGASFSGEEMARSIASVATCVYHSARTWPNAGLPGSGTEVGDGGVAPAPEPRDNVERVAMVEELGADGSARLRGGRRLEALDAVLWCTGYCYALPWMEHLGAVAVEPMHLSPLFLHMWPLRYAPSLALVGVTWLCARVPQFQLQGHLLARVLSGRAALPPYHDMLQYEQRLAAARRLQGIPDRYSHAMPAHVPQPEWQYNDLLSDLAGAEALRCPDWLRGLGEAFRGSILCRPDTFRDVWTAAEEKALSQAQAACLVLWREWLPPRTTPPQSA